MRWKLIALVIISLQAALSSAVAENLAIKATTPVEVSIYPVTTVERGGLSTFTVRAESSLPSEDFVIEIVPGKGSQLVEGELFWQGPVMPGIPRELTVTLRMANDAVPTVSVKSTINTGGSVQFAASATYRQQIQMPAAYQSVSKERKVPRKGRQVIEYRVK